jgi:dephospho-CoA kinase
LKKIAITGGIGSGKSTVCKVFEQLGFPVFYSDVEAKNILTENNLVKSQIIELLGEEAYQNNELNRSYISGKIFNNFSLKEKMNSIVHPAVRLAFENWATTQKSRIVFNEAAILFEMGAYKNFDSTILVTSPASLKIKRIIARDNCTEQEARLRIQNQWADDKKIKLADYILNNNEKEPLLQQILDLAEILSN